LKTKTVKYDNIDLFELPPDSEIWRLGSSISTCRVETSYTKELNKWHSLELALETYEKWLSLGFKGAPSSPCTVFHKINNSGVALNYSQNKYFAELSRGGWQQVFKYGSIAQHVRYYDIKAAYYSAGLNILPKKIRVYTKGDKYFLAIMKLDIINPNLPPAFRRKLVVCDYIDIDTYNLKGEIIFGVAWDKSDIINLQETWENIKKLGLNNKTVKKMMQTYWGRWGMTKPVIRETRRGGSVISQSQIKNNLKNAVWSCLIINRVTRKVWRVVDSKNVLLVLTDAVLTTDKIETGSTAGSWVKKLDLPDGVIIKAPGVWSGLLDSNKNVNEWEKHSGHKAKEV
jgi:hypothetical protein